jgi:ATP-dependent DNA helicase RecQ
MNNSFSILKNIFGFNSFRPLQKEIIDSVLNGIDSLVVMPTGGGKSLCYQIPSQQLEGITVVISPLISLMKDQVTQLRQAGINASLLNSSLSAAVYKKNYEDVSSGNAKLLYLAPESLFKDEIISILKEKKLSCITVDEAHCISEWGHDFRKDYRQLGKLREMFPHACCIALTATATPRVQDDIVSNLNLKNHKKFIASFNRENLFLQVAIKYEPLKQTVDFLKAHPNQPGIIYCFSRKQVDELSEQLNSLGFSTAPYHAGLSDEDRNKNQDLFIKDEVEIIVATIAFGMGINKSNVRFVIHYDLPKNVESYYQEIGRSGRDGVRADCLLLFSYSDIAKIKYFINQKEDDIERLSALYHLEAMVKYAESEICRRIPLIKYFGEKYDHTFCEMCDNCLREVKNKIDITIPAQKFLSAAKRTGEKFGAVYLIELLLGSSTERIFSNGHQNLSVYGIGKELKRNEWMQISRQLIQKEIIKQDLEFGSLKLTPKAAAVLFNQEKVFALIHEEKKKEVKEAKIVFDDELFNILRRKRKDISEKSNIPPYIVFSDKSLIEMSSKKPVNKEAFQNISGVGRKKYELYGDIFITEIKSYCTRKNLIPRKVTASKREEKVKKYLIIGEAFSRGKSLNELSEYFKIKEETIINHIERYIDEGNPVRKTGIEKAVTFSKNRWEEIFGHFDELGLNLLAPVYEKMNQEVSYYDLRLLKILYILKHKELNK